MTGDNMAQALASRLDEILETCSELAEDVSYPSVKRWREDHPGGQVVGHFQVYFPEELIHAAGMLPISLMGAGSKLEAKQADSHIGSFICSICRTSLELGFSDRVGFLDAFYTTPICDVARNLASIWGRELQGHDGGDPLPAPERKRQGRRGLPSRRIRPRPRRVGANLWPTGRR